MIADGRYTQALTCPQKTGEPMHVMQSGTFSASGFVGQVKIVGVMPKGAVHIVLDQHSVRIGV